MGPSARRRLARKSVIDAPVEEVFAWHERPGAIERLTPPWEPITVERAAPSLEPGSKTVFRARIPGPLPLRWVAEHIAYDPPTEFRDVQVSGPFAWWEHRHGFAALDGSRTLVTDEVTYALPLARVGDVGTALVHRRVERMLAYRHRQLQGDVAAHRRARDRGGSPMHVAVTGSSGLIGSALAAFLASGGHRVTRLVRRLPSAPDEVFWDPIGGTIDAEGLRGVDAVVTLAGAPIGSGYWTEERKRRIRDSRVSGTRLLAETLAHMPDGPRVLVCGSAIGYYGHDRGGETLTEDAASGGGFLADLVRAWEGAADPAREAGIRVVHVRTGVVQSPRGGTLQLQLPLFWLGLGGPLGSGRQWTSWIGIDDIVGIFHHALTTPDLHGAVNGTAPIPVTNAEYTRTLGRVVRRPALLPVPKIGPSVLLSPEGAEETAFADQRVLPERAEASGYAFRQRDLDSALRHVLGRTSS
ncbi:MAG: TIGR01777 family oxidoreductase [Streptosporangiaceae bacterium]